MPLGELGRKEPTDWRHVERYPLTALGDEAPIGLPVVFGINWYASFDSPQADSQGRYWIGRGSSLGSYRGGHAIMGKSKQPDAYGWWEFYNQNPYGGACVGFSESRMMSHLNRVKYDGAWLYWEAQKTDHWAGGAYPGWEQDGQYYEGTSLSSGLEILRLRGHKTPTGQPRVPAGISAYRWLQTVDEVHRTLAMPLADTLGAVPLVNSWGTWYPRIVWLPDAVLSRLLNENGECAVVTDR